eukprot:2034378-Amphidinium_carterae.1
MSAFGRRSGAPKGLASVVKQKLPAACGILRVKTFLFNSFGSSAPCCEHRRDGVHGIMMYVLHDWVRHLFRVGLYFQSTSRGRSGPPHLGREADGFRRCGCFCPVVFANARRRPGCGQARLRGVLLCGWSPAHRRSLVTLL